MEFAPSLAENQVMVLLPQFMALLRRQIHCATSREMYRYWAQTVRQTAEQFPVFKAHLQELVQAIKAEFPRKPALQEELRKLKFWLREAAWKYGGKAALFCVKVKDKAT